MCLRNGVVVRFREEGRGEGEEGRREPMEGVRVEQEWQVRSRTDQVGR